MTKLKKNIMNALITGEALTVPEIAFAALAYKEIVQEVLHELDDQGLVTMRNGFYKASALGLALSNKTD